jgi:hypothetical protein
MNYRDAVKRPALTETPRPAAGGFWLIWPESLSRTQRR